MKEIDLCCNALFYILAPEASPERVRCEPLSAQAIRVWWEPPPVALRGGVLLGYEVLYEVIIFIVKIKTKQAYIYPTF